MIHPQHIRGQTVHARKGDVKNAFRYAIDYVLLDPKSSRGPRLFSRNRRNLFSVFDSDHGGDPHHGRGLLWAEEVLAAFHIPCDQILLLAQPRMLGHVFNPVSFWLAYNGADLIAVIAEVTNTFGDRHSYLCHLPDLRAITAQDHLTAQKIFHVSPFQPIEGGYDFRFDIRPDHIGIFINFSDTKRGGVYATLTGARQTLGNRSILKSIAARPLGSRRVLALIHWQAIKLWWKGATFRSRPLPPTKDVSQ